MLKKNRLFSIATLNFPVTFNQTIPILINRIKYFLLENSFLMNNFSRLIRNIIFAMKISHFMIFVFKSKI